MLAFSALVLSVLAASVSASTIVVTVGGNTTSNPGAVFSPQSVKVTQGDTLLFNFTMGNHSATQSTFASPCIPAHFSNASINGFDSGPRDTVNGSAITNMPVPITDNSTIWFYDSNSCGLGGVGGANINETSLQSLAGFTRNAKRLNGTATSTSSSSSATGTSSGKGSSSGSSTASPSSTSTSSSDATRLLTLGASAVVPVFFAALLYL